MSKNITHVRVESKHYHDRERGFKILLQKFKRECNEYGIMHEFKRHEYFESKSRQKRRKKKESEARIQKEHMLKQILQGQKVPGVSKTMVSKLLAAVKKSKRDTEIGDSYY